MSFAAASTCLIWLSATTSAVLPLELHRIRPSIFPWDERPEWFDTCQVSSGLTAPSSRPITGILGKKLGYGRTGIVCPLLNSGCVAKIAVYDDYDKWNIGALEGIHIEAGLYETLLVPLQGVIVPRYGGLFSNHETQLGNHRMLVLEDCGPTLPFNSSFDDYDLETRVKVYNMICQIYDCGVAYDDLAPRNVCVGADNKTFRIIDFDGCCAFSGNSFSKFKKILRRKFKLSCRLKLPAAYLPNCLYSGPSPTLCGSTSISMESSAYSISDLNWMDLQTSYRDTDLQQKDAPCKTERQSHVSLPQSKRFKASHAGGSINLLNK